MEIAALFFLTSGLFLGWALGANDAANVFGTAVGTRMIRFTTAAIICSIFVVLGAVISGAGASHTLGKLGAINAMGGSFMAAFSAGFAVYTMTKFGLPVSTTQAIVGSIIGWNLFSETVTDTASLIKILSTWVVCPILAATFAIILFKLVTVLLKKTNFHLLRTDAYTRIGLILAGAFGAYSLGANNIANVVGVFVPSSPFTDFDVMGLMTISSIQQLFLMGALAIAVGVITYSKRVMMTVGDGLLPMSPVAAWVVVVSHSLVLFLFASQGLEQFLASHGLPTIPLVPVSSSQAVVGAVIGIGILKGGRGVRWRILGGISMGWMMTPIIAGIICFVGLFFLQNVFNQEVYSKVPYALSDPVMKRLEHAGVPTEPVHDLKGRLFTSGKRFEKALDERMALSYKEKSKFMDYARVDELVVDMKRASAPKLGGLSAGQIKAIRALGGQTFPHLWMFDEALARTSGEWQARDATTANKAHNKDLKTKLTFLHRLFRAKE